MSATLEEAKKLIDELDLTHVINRVVKEKRWSLRMASVAAQFYKNFLYLSKKHPQYNLSPTRQIDEIWHAHILYTKDYRAFCDQVFGHYLNHQPTHEDEASSEEAPIKESEIDLLQRLHQQEFQGPIYDAIYSFKDVRIFLRRKFGNQ